MQIGIFGCGGRNASAVEGKQDAGKIGQSSISLVCKLTNEIAWLSLKTMIFLLQFIRLREKNSKSFEKIAATPLEINVITNERLKEKKTW